MRKRAKVRARAATAPRLPITAPMIVPVETEAEVVIGAALGLADVEAAGAAAPKDGDTMRVFDAATVANIEPEMVTRIVAVGELEIWLDEESVENPVREHNATTDIERTVEPDVGHDLEVDGAVEGEEAVRELDTAPDDLLGVVEIR